MCDLSTAIIGAGALGSIASGLIGSSAATSAAKTQAAAATNAANMAQAQYGQTRADLLPYNQAGQYATNQLVGALPGLTAPFNMTEANLEATPGYQFQLDQGLKATQSAAAAKGQGISGAALKGAAQYATGLADSNYQNQFNNYQTTQNNAYNKLLGIGQLGENAGAQTGNLGQQATNTATNALTGGAAASAAGTVGAANALSNSINGVGTAGLNYLLLPSLLSRLNGGGTTGASTQNATNGQVF
ncbi:MAG TPA: hypothetical protein VN702_17595 [Acetobacteraceae bacterium]|nr:hypothetical protein [Acetobacteraceae bacterium]